MKEYKQQITVRTTQDVMDMIQTEAERLNISKNLVVHMILKRVVKEYGKKV